MPSFQLSNFPDLPGYLIGPFFPHGSTVSDLFALAGVTIAIEINFLVFSSPYFSYFPWLI